MNRSFTRLSLAVLIAAFMTTAFTSTEPPSKQAHYAIEGPFCSGCVSELESVVLGISGVKRIEVDVQEYLVVVTYDPDATTAQEILTTISDETTFHLSLIEINDVEPQGDSSLNQRFCC